MKKNLFNFNLSNSSDSYGSLEGQITCEPCSSECERIERKINNRKLSEIEKDEALDILTPFKRWYISYRGAHVTLL